MNVTIYAHPTKATAFVGLAKWLVFSSTDDNDEVSVCLDNLPPAVADALLAVAEGTPTCPAS